MKTSVIIGIVIIILALGGGVWYAYSNPAIAAQFGLSHPAPVMGGMGRDSGMGTTSPYGGRGMRGGFAVGTIEVLNDTGFTITVANGDTKNVTLTATTTLQNYSTASSTPTTITADQLSVGEQVMVIGDPNPDGSITARVVRTGVHHL